MKLFALALFTASLTASSFAVVLDFEDLSGGGAMPTTYAGFADWTSFQYYDDPQSPYNPASGSQRLYTREAEGIVDIGFDVVFNGAYFSGPDVTSVSYNLYNDNVLVGTSASLNPSSVPTFLDSGYSGMVDKVGIVATTAGGYYVMDDFTYNAVPEPGTLAILGLGAAALRRRRKA